MTAVSKVRELAAARERARIETVLHGDALQTLYAVSLSLDLTAVGASDEVGARIVAAVDAIHGVIANVRTALR